MLSGLILFSCGEDEPEIEEVCDDLSTLLIGVWESDENPSVTVEFMTSNLIVDDAFLFVDNDFEVGDVVGKVYSVTGNEEIDFAYSSGFNFRSRNGKVQEFTCETFRISVNGAIRNFTKK